jgi:sterol desaturase/sphingolipid hydroxylase (fatty acid hydroxylase superfamily)
VYLGSILLIVAGEALFPRRALRPGMGGRWLNNLLVHAIDIGVIRWAYPLVGVGVAVWGAQRGWGMLSLLEVPVWLAWLLTFLLLDLAYYAQHRLLHHVPWLWRLHRMHHTDRDYDFSTGLRFHPLEALFTTGYDIVVVLLLGAPPEAVALYGFVHLGWSILVHANIAVPTVADRLLRRVLVTPDLHRTHHSAEPGESLTNFGAVSPVWDRLFGSYLDQPAKGQQGMVIGLPGYQDARHQRLDDMLLQPFLAARDNDLAPIAPAGPVDGR